MPASRFALCFTTPTRAWLLDLQVNGGHRHDNNYVNDSLQGQSYTSNAVIDARIGRRFGLSVAATVYF